MEYYLLTILKFVIGFSIVIVHMNLLGKTQLSQMTPVDFIGNFVLGGIIGGVIYSDTIPLHQYIILLLIGVSLISLLNILTRKFSFFRSVAIGEPIILIKDGKFVMENILEKENKIDILNISSRLHTQGIKSFKDIYFAQIEPDGQLTAVLDEKSVPSVILIKGGKIRPTELETIGKDEDWLNLELQKARIKNIDDIFLAEFCDEEINFVMNDGVIYE